MFFNRLVGGQPQRGREALPSSAFTNPIMPRGVGPAMPLRSDAMPFAGSLANRPFLDRASRRMDDLARRHNCLGYFDDGDDDRPRAA